MIGARPETGRDFVSWALLLALETAMRPSEFLAARVGQVRLAERHIFLPTSKNDDPRRVPLSKRAIQLCATLVQGRRPQDDLFPIDSNAMGRHYRAIRAEAKLDPDLKFYDIKHEAITRMKPKFKDALELSKVTGHRDLRSLAVYFNPTVDELADRLDG